MLFISILKRVNCSCQWISSLHKNFLRYKKLIQIQGYVVQPVAYPQSKRHLLFFRAHKTKWIKNIRRKYFISFSQVRNWNREIKLALCTPAPRTEEQALWIKCCDWTTRHPSSSLPCHSYSYLQRKKEKTLPKLQEIWHYKLSSRSFSIFWIYNQGYNYLFCFNYFILICEIYKTHWPVKCKWISL